MILALLLAAVAPAPEPPAVVAAHIREGELDIRDPSWLRGGLPGADAQQQEQWAAIKKWLDACLTAQTNRTEAELRRLSVTPTALPKGYYADANCAAASNLRWRVKSYRDWASFSSAFSAAQAHLDIMLYGARLGFESTPFDPDWVKGNATAMKLLRATVREQVLRNAFQWRQDGQGPKFADDIWPILESLIGAATTREDHRNTAMLKELVAASGWPTISAVGARASNAAWLLVKHADDDPAFQLRALRLMEPLATTGDVAKRNYAYLYDRVMLKITGKQRYATQIWCQGDKRVPQPLESDTNIDATRASMDLEPVAEYLKSFERFPPCPK